ncbi:MAG: hypothetical protein METHAR1v1_1680016 [Methanothrix sp.]|nr:MAG: hypothetical protein METHAR1v1_1680016 [Methanothrix sp.]
MTDLFPVLVSSKRSIHASDYTLNLPPLTQIFFRKVL